MHHGFERPEDYVAWMSDPSRVVHVEWRKVRHERLGWSLWRRSRAAMWVTSRLLGCCASILYTDYDLKQFELIYLNQEKYRRYCLYGCCKEEPWLDVPLLA